MRVRAQGAHRGRSAQGKEAIIVTELPFQVKKGGDGGLIKKIADLVRDKKIPEISDLRDESDRRGMRLVIELKRDAIPKVVLNKLYKHTPMQTTFGVNMVALVDGVPRTLVAARGHPPLRRAPARGRRAPHEVRAAPSASARAHILEGLLIALDNLDEVIALIRGVARPRRGARRGLVERFELTAIQADGDPRPAPVAADRARGRRDQAGARRHDRAHRASCARSSATRTRVLGAHQGGARRDRRRASATSGAREITDSEDEIDIEDLIADQQMVITITQVGLHQVAAARDLPPAAPRRRAA